jgi:hypothetical protein
MSTAARRRSSGGGGKAVAKQRERAEHLQDEGASRAKIKQIPGIVLQNNMRAGVCRWPAWKPRVVKPLAEDEISSHLKVLGLQYNVLWILRLNHHIVCKM